LDAVKLFSRSNTESAGKLREYTFFSRLSLNAVLSIVVFPVLVHETTVKNKKTTALTVS